ncbi:manganese efflux pump [Desulfosporosinus sp. SB140]|uniref:manganese efflux pump n=1 Tax=Desulfosporosinus paludis TaxID=3115649 RepID=UPI00388F56EA
MLWIGVASNLDNAGVGIAYGLRKTRIPLTPNSIIALMGFSLSCVGGILGNWISFCLTPFTCQIISTTVLVSIGVYVLSQQYFNKKPKEHLSEDNLILRVLRNPEEADLDNSKSISLFESVILGIALSLNNLAGGFSAGITHLNILMTSSISGFFSFICTGLCAIFSLKFAAGRLGEKATTISGILLILVGVRQIIS